MLAVVVLLAISAILLVGIGVVLVLAWRQGDASVVRRVGGQPADEREHARLHNIVDGLCLAAGVPKPSLFVLDDPAPNTLATGIDPARSSLVVTTGLLELLTRVELEGVIAHQLVRIKNKELVRPTLAANLPSFLTFLVRTEPSSPSEIDVAAVSLTRYPPGLLTALEKMTGTAAAVPEAPSALAQLWLVPPGAPLEERIDVLREL